MLLGVKDGIGPILFLCYEESLVSSNLISKQLRFLGAHPNLYIFPFLIMILVLEYCLDRKLMNATQFEFSICAHFRNLIEIKKEITCHFL